MSAIVTENWSARSWQATKSATRQFVVTGVTGEAAARSATGTMGMGMGVGFPQDSTIRVIEPPTVDTAKGPLTYTVTYNYAPQPGLSPGNVSEKLSREPL